MTAPQPQSFMELAGAWPHEHDEGAQLQVDRDKCRYNCRRCQLEALVQQHAGVVDELEELPQIRYASSGDDTEPSGYYVPILAVQSLLARILGLSKETK